MDICLIKIELKSIIHRDTIKAQCKSHISHSKIVFILKNNVERNIKATYDTHLI